MTEHTSAAITPNSRIRSRRALLAIGAAILSLPGGVATANAATTTAPQKASQRIAKAVTQTKTVTSTSTSTSTSTAKTDTKTVTESKTEAPRTETQTRTKTVSDPKPGGVSVSQLEVAQDQWDPDRS